MEGVQPQGKGEELANNKELNKAKIRRRNGFNPC